MKRWLFVALAAPLAAAAVEIDGIAASVGSESILRSEVETEMRRTGATGKEAFAAARNRLIERLLILKAAGSSKMTMQEWVVDDRIRTIIDDGFNGDRNQLIEALSREKMPYSDWRKRIKDDLIVNAMRWQVVDKNVRASPSAMRKEYEASKETYASPGTVTVSVILLKPEDVGKRDEVSQALKTMPFGDVAKKYSSDGKAADGGVWKDVVPSETFKKEICDEIAKTPVGTISKWGDMSGWSFLLRKDAETPGAARSFAEAYSDIESKVRAAESKRLYDAWMERLKAETHIHVY